MTPMLQSYHEMQIVEFYTKLKGIPVTSFQIAFVLSISYLEYIFWR